MKLHTARANAGALGRAFGKKLIGHVVEVGNWEGCMAVITEYTPDPAAPEIPYWVRDLVSGKEIGIFDSDEMSLFVTAEQSMALHIAMTLGDVCRDMLTDAMHGRQPDNALMNRAVLALAAAGFVAPAMRDQSVMEDVA